MHKEQMAGTNVVRTRQTGNRNMMKWGIYTTGEGRQLDTGATNRGGTNNKQQVEKENGEKQEQRKVG